MNTKTIAILVRKPEQIHIHLSATEHLSQTGSNIEIFLLGPIPCSAMDDNGVWSKQFSKTGVKCFSDTSGLFELYGFQVADMAEIARRIGKADMVIPL